MTNQKTAAQTINDLNKMAAVLAMRAQSHTVKYEYWGREHSLALADEAEQLSRRIREAASSLESVFDSSGLINN